MPGSRTTKFHVVWRANAAVDRMRRTEPRDHKFLKGPCGSLPEHCASLKPKATADLDAPIARMSRVRTARAWAYEEQWGEIPERKQLNVVRAMLKYWCTCVMHSKVEPMTKVAALVCRHLEGIVRLGAQASDQRLPRGPQRPAPGRQKTRPSAAHASRRSATSSA